MEIESLKTEIKNLADADLLSLLEFVSNETKFRNLHKLNESGYAADMSESEMAAKLDKMMEALKNLGLSVEDAKRAVPKNGYRPGHWPRK